MSVTVRSCGPLCTGSRVNVGVADKAFVERKTPRWGSALNDSPLKPLMPEAVETRILFESAGLTRILVIARPVNTSLTPLLLKGPVTAGLTVEALRIM